MSLYECVHSARNDVTQQKVEGSADSIANPPQAEGDATKQRAPNVELMAGPPVQDRNDG